MDFYIKPNGFVLGFDPGGRERFGWSICKVSNGRLQRPSNTGLANDAWDALCQVKEALERCESPENLPVLAAGIDAPMFWGCKGSREVDDFLRRALADKGFPTASGTVQQVNSLRGACLVQGMLLGKYIQETWSLTITEAHPKALKHLLKHSEMSEAVEMVEQVTAGLADHKRDATLAAVAAWAMIHESSGWQDLYNLECHPVQPFNTPVSYWMPVPDATSRHSLAKSC